MDDGKGTEDLVLGLLSRYHPIKANERDIVASLRSERGQNEAEIRAGLDSLRAAGLVELTVAQPGGDNRYSLTEKGRETVQAKGLDASMETISPREIESRLISNYDRIKADMETVRQNLEKNQRTLETEMSDIRKSMGEHDQFVKTYMVRIVESISMFIGIFAIVVVMMVNVLKDMTTIADKTILIMFVITLPTLLIATIIPGLWLIRKMILEPKPRA